MNYYYSSLQNRQAPKEKLFSMGEKLLLFILFLSCIDFYAYGMHIMLIAFMVYAFLGGRVFLNNGLVPVAFLSLSLLLFWDGALDGPSAISRWMMYPFAYIIGYGMVVPKENEKTCIEKAEKRANICFVVATLGFFAHLLLNFLYNRGADVGRNTVDFWTKEVRSATGQASFACIPVGLSISLLLADTTFKKKIPAIIGLGVILIYNLTLSTRTVFFLVALVAAAALYYKIRHSDNKKRLKTFLAIIVVVVVSLILYNVDAFGIRTTIESSNFFARFFGRNKQDLGSDGRLANKLQYLKWMIYYPWGGGHIHRFVGGYAHDLFLDTYDEAGIFALLAVIILICDATVRLVRVMRSSSIGMETRLTIVSIYAAIYIEFMVEPIFVGMPGLLLTFIFFHGMVTRLSLNAQMLTDK